MSMPNSILFRPAIDRLVAIPMGSTQTSRTGGSKLALPNGWRVCGEPGRAQRATRVRCTRGLGGMVLFIHVAHGCRQVSVGLDLDDVVAWISDVELSLFLVRAFQEYRWRRQKGDAGPTNPIREALPF